MATGASLLAAWGCKSRKAKMERAILALMDQLDMLHFETHRTELSKGLAKQTCSCADAYKMGKEALKV